MSRLQGKRWQGTRKERRVSSYVLHDVVVVAKGLFFVAVCGMVAQIGVSRCKVEGSSVNRAE
jgi:hypothetical protein